MIFCRTAPVFLLSSVLCVSGVALARTTHTRVPNTHAMPRHMTHGLSRRAVHAEPLAALPVLEPGIVPEPDADLPAEGHKYSLKLAALHTGESIDIVYRIGNTYIPAALEKLNHFLRDHRTDEVNQYDPKEFDLLHNVLSRLGKPQGTVDVVCGYRSAETNALLRQNDPATGVAEHSQHIEGRAIDIRVPGVQTARLRNAALSLEAGGVGYYPKSQFVHVDVGPVRTWTFGASAAKRIRKAHHRKG